MSKLLRNADPTNLLVALGNDMEPPPRPPPSLPIADGLLETLPAFPKAPPPTAQDFDLPAFVDTARRLLGSPERLQTVRRTMGRLSPRSNDRFLTELELGTPPSPPVRDGGLTPPPLPSVGSSEPDSSPVAMERTGAPAVLRRKARRLDRGYRCADVLRARLGDSPGRPRQARVERTETEDEEVGGLERPLLTSDPFQMLVEVAAVERKQTAMGKGSGESGKRRMSEGGRRRKRRKTKGSNA